MQRLLPALLALTLATPAAALETRCGWLDNPTPANWWLTDADGEWTVSLQGQGDRSGIFDRPWNGTRDWVETNGSYGFGCACMGVDVDRKSRWITNAEWVDWLPLRQCLADPALPER